MTAVQRLQRERRHDQSSNRNAQRHQAHQQHHEELRVFLAHSGLPAPVALVDVHRVQR